MTQPQTANTYKTKCFISSQFLQWAFIFWATLFLTSTTVNWEIAVYYMWKVLMPSGDFAAVRNSISLLPIQFSSSCAEHWPVYFREAVSAQSESHSNVIFWSRQQSPPLYLLSGHYSKFCSLVSGKEEMKKSNIFIYIYKYIKKTCVTRFEMPNRFK